jgi:CubicO group peptidase (beta-lactamase class C family)
MYSFKRKNVISKLKTQCLLKHLRFGGDISSVNLQAMKQLLIVLFISFLFPGICRSQPQAVKDRISRVENNLVQSAKVIFADSAVPAHNIRERMQFHKVPAVSIAVIHNGKLEWAKAYGYMDEKQAKPATEATLFQAASLSKSVNALCVVKLAEQGQLSLDQDIRGYLKSWKFPDNEHSEGKPITLRALLSHTAGLGVHGFRGYAYDDKLPSVNTILDGGIPANNDAVKPIRRPGIQMEYSGGGTVITRKILEDMIAPDYAELVKKVVMKPLGMNRSFFGTAPGEGEKNIATAFDASGNALYGGYFRYPELAPDALWTTPTDLSRFIIALQGSLKGASGFLNPKMAEEMMRPVLDNAGLGVFITEKGGHKYFTHTGANYGYRSFMIGGIDNGEGIVILTNSENGEALYSEIINSVAKVYGWKGFYDPELRKLVPVTTKMKEDFAGSYDSEKPPITLGIVPMANSLQLSTRGTDNLEDMLFVSPTEFFLPSSPSTFAEFKNMDGKDMLLVKENGRELFRASRREPGNHRPVFPGRDWEFVQRPERMGWNIGKLEGLKLYLRDSTDITGYMIVHQGKAVFSYGDIAENSYIASCRKSVLSLLYGRYVKDGTIGLASTLYDLGINDLPPLFPQEKEATINDILSARSGVYHPASNGGDNAADAPPRGSVKHGGYWLYNNWDFNVAGHIFEKLTGKDIYNEVETQLALPLLMQDWNRGLQQKDGDLSRSLYPSYPMWFSTRDMARLGLLMLNEGKWGTQQVVDGDWCRTLIVQRTGPEEVDRNIPDFRGTGYSFAYGYMWWLWQNARNEKYKGAYSAFGVMGQGITVFPGADVVITYKTKAAYERENRLSDRLKIISLGLDALEK